MMTWNKIENTITDYKGTPHEIESVGSANSGRCLDFAVKGLNYYITCYPDNLTIIDKP